MTSRFVWRSRSRLERSLVEAVIVQFLQETAEQLTAEHPGRSFSNIKDGDHLFLKASKRMMTTAAVAGGNERGLHGLFDACNTLSTLKYEGKEGIGNIVFARPMHPHVNVDLALSSPVPQCSRAARRNRTKRIFRRSGTPPRRRGAK